MKQRARKVFIDPTDSVQMPQMLDRVAGKTATSLLDPDIQAITGFSRRNVKLDHLRFSVDAATAVVVDGFSISLEKFADQDVHLSFREERPGLLAILLNGTIHAYMASPTADLHACDPDVEHLVLYGRATGPGIESLSRLRSLCIQKPQDGDIRVYSRTDSLRHLQVVSDVPVDLSTLDAPQLETVSIAAPGTVAAMLSRFSSLRSLSLFQCDGIDDLSIVSELSGLTSLSLLGLDKNHPIPALENLANLEELDLGYVDTVPRMPSALRRLSLSARDLNTIEGLDNVRNLEHLSLSGIGAVTDLGPVAGLQGLRSLMIDDGKSLESLSPLAQLPHLEHVQFGLRTPVRRLDWLTGAGALRTLAFYRANALESLAPLASVPELQELHLGGISRVRSFEGLSSLEQLRRLQISDYGPFFKAEDLGSHPKLEHLSIISCYMFASLDGLQDSHALRSLRVVNCPPIADLGPVASLTKLETIEVATAGVTDIDALATCTSLATIILAELPLRNIEAAARLHSLVTLTIGATDSLNDISALTGHPSLQALRVWRTVHLREIGPAATIPNLRELSVHHSIGIEDSLVLTYLQKQGVNVVGYPIENPNQKPPSTAEIDALLSAQPKTTPTPEKPRSSPQRLLDGVETDWAALSPEARSGIVDLYLRLTDCDRDIPKREYRDQALKFSLRDSWSDVWGNLPGSSEWLTLALSEPGADLLPVLEPALRDLVSKGETAESRVRGGLVSAFIAGLAEDLDRGALAYVLARPMSAWVPAGTAGIAPDAIRMDNLALAQIKDTTQEMEYLSESHGFYGSGDGPWFQQSHRDPHKFYYLDRYFALRCFDNRAGLSTTVKDLMGPVSNALRNQLNETRMTANDQHFWFDEERGEAYVVAGPFDPVLRCVRLSDGAVLFETDVETVSVVHPLPDGGVRILAGRSERYALDVDHTGIRARYDFPFTGAAQSSPDNRLGNFFVYDCTTSVVFMHVETGETVEYPIAGDNERIHAARVVGDTVVVITSRRRLVRLSAVDQDPRRGITAEEAEVPVIAQPLADGRALRIEMEGNIIQAGRCRVFLAETLQAADARLIIDLPEAEAVTACVHPGGSFQLVVFLQNQTEVYYGSLDSLEGPVSVQAYPGEAATFLRDADSGYRLRLRQSHPTVAVVEGPDGKSYGEFRVPSIVELVGIDPGRRQVTILRGRKMESITDTRSLPDTLCTTYDWATGDLRDGQLPYTGVIASAMFDAAGVLATFGDATRPLYLRSDPVMDSPSHDPDARRRQRFTYAYDAATSMLAVQGRGATEIDLGDGTVRAHYPFSTLTHGHVGMYSILKPARGHVYVFDLEHGIFAYDYRTNALIWAQRAVAVPESSTALVVSIQSKPLVVVGSRERVTVLDAETGALLGSYAWQDPPLKQTPQIDVHRGQLIMYTQADTYRLPLPDRFSAKP